MRFSHFGAKLAIYELKICDHLASCPRFLSIDQARGSVRHDALQKFLGFDPWKDRGVEDFPQLPLIDVDGRGHVL